MAASGAFPKTHHDWTDAGDAVDSTARDSCPITRPLERVILFSCADRLGREIVLYEDTWYDHILARRSILAGHEIAVLATLEGAEHIRIDRRDQNRRWYDRLVVLPPPNGHDFVKVIVEFNAAQLQGVVVTAFTVDGPNPNERWEY